MKPTIRVIPPTGQAYSSLAPALEKAGFTLEECMPSQEGAPCPSVVLADLTTAHQDVIGALEILEKRCADQDIILLLLIDDKHTHTAFPLTAKGHSILWHVAEPPENAIERLDTCLRKRAYLQRRLRVQTMIPLYRIAQAFTDLTNLSDLLQSILETAIQETGADRGSIMLLDEGSQTLYIGAAVGLPRDVVEHHRQKVGEGIAGWVAEHQRPLILTEGDIPPFALPWLRGRNAYSSISVPMLHQGTLVGVLNLTKRPGKTPFIEGDVEFITILATQAAAAIQNARLFSQIQEAYHQLQHLDRLRTQIIDIAAHELRTPVSVIKGYMELLQELGLPELDAYLPPILRSVQKLESLARDLFELSTLHALERAPTPQRVDTSRWLAHLLEEYRPQAEAKGITLESHIAPEAAYALFDPEHVAAILHHLLRNALKFTPAGGRVRVSAERVRNDFVIHVDDSGPGIPPGERERIFQEFYQIEEVETRHHEGLGIGLALARTLAHAHHALLRVEESPLGGARFSVYIPQPVQEEPTQWVSEKSSTHR